LPWTGHTFFPCHRRTLVSFDGVAVTTEPVQFWEQECPNPMCGRRWRFRRGGMWLAVAEFRGAFTEPKPAQQTSPAPTWEVLARITGEAMRESA
jgi:hypothetical protein